MWVIVEGMKVRKGWKGTGDKKKGRKEEGERCGTWNGMEVRIAVNKQTENRIMLF